MDLVDYLDHSKVKDFYDSFKFNLKYSANGNTIPVLYNGKLVQAKVTQPVEAGEVTIIKTGNQFFVTQEKKAPNKYTRTQEYVDIYRPEETGKTTILLFVLSDYLPFNIDLRNVANYRVDTLPTLQVLEDIYLIDDYFRFNGLEKKDLRLDANESEVKEPYLTFFSYLKKEKSYPYKSFYNFLLDEQIKDEGLALSSFELDNKSVSINKLRLFEYPFMFPNSALYENFIVRTARRVPEEKIDPFIYDDNPIHDIPEKTATFEEVYLKFYSGVKEDTPDTDLSWDYLPSKIKNMEVINKLCPKIEEYDYSYFAIEVLERDNDARTITYKQKKTITKPMIGYSSTLDPIVILNYDLVFVGMEGILKHLPEGVYFQEIGETLIKVEEKVDDEIGEIRFIGVNNSKVKGNVIISNYGEIVEQDQGILRYDEGVYLEVLIFATI